MLTTAIVFDHRGRTAKGKKGPLEVRITADRKSYYVGTGIKVMASEWKFGRVVNRGDMDVLNRRLEAIERRVMDEVSTIIEQRLPICAAEIKRRVWGISSEVVREAATFLDWFEEQVAVMNIAEGTRKHYYTTLARMRACAIIKCWEDITADNICKFDEWLHRQTVALSVNERAAGMTVKCLSDATIHNHHKCLKHIVWQAVAVGKMDGNPYDRLRGKFKRGESEAVDYLTEEEVKRIMGVEVRDGMTRTARDLFVFQCYTGMSYSDAQSFDIRDYRLVDGRWVCVRQRVKTGVAYVSQLLPPAVEVLDRYGMQVPRISNQKYNQALKALGVAAGITIRMHSHLARHTFATMMLRNGVKLENLKAMMGHRKIEQTMRYAKVVAASVHEDFERMARLLEGERKPEADASGTAAVGEREEGGGNEGPRALGSSPSEKRRARWRRG